MIADVRSLSDDELLAACRLTAREQRWHDTIGSGWGCIAALVIGAAIAWAAYALIGGVASASGWPVALACGAIGLAIACVAWFRLERHADRRRKPYWDELRRRFTTFDQHEQQATHDLIIDVTGCGLPHGGHFAIRVRVGPGDSGVVERKTLTPNSLPMQTDELHCSASTDRLDSADARRIRALAAAVTVMRASIPSEVLDGVPVRMTVFAGGKTIAELECNLVGIPAKRANEPIVRLLKACCDLRDGSGAAQ